MPAHVAYTAIQLDTAADGRVDGPVDCVAKLLDTDDELTLFHNVSNNSLDVSP